MIELNKIYNEDCLEGMKRIPDGGVEHNEETMKRIKQNKVRVITENRENADPGLMIAHWKRTRKMDEFRILSGEAQKTNFKFRKRPLRIMRAISQLIHKYNYFRDEKVGGLYTLFYDDETKRTKTKNTLMLNTE